MNKTFFLAVGLLLLVVAFGLGWLLVAPDVSMDAVNKVRMATCSAWDFAKHPRRLLTEGLIFFA